MWHVVSGLQKGPAERGHVKNVKNRQKVSKLSTSDFQSEVGEVFGEIGGELPAKFGRRFSSFFCWENRQKNFPPKLHRKFTIKLHYEVLGCGGPYKTIFDTFRQFSRRAKNVKHRQKVSKIFSTLFDNFRAAPVFRIPVWGALMLMQMSCCKKDKSQSAKRALKQTVKSRDLVLPK